jgi:hypothetical protein
MGHGRCADWKIEVSSNKISPIWCLPIGKYYANKNQVEGLISYHENKKNGIEFMVGDKVFDLIKGNGEVFRANQGYGYAVWVVFEDGTERGYSRNGKTTSGGNTRMLFHGHDLTLTINEKVPVRTRSVWVYIFSNEYGKMRVSSPHNTEEECLTSLRKMKIIWGANILSDPIKVAVNVNE